MKEYKIIKGTTDYCEKLLNQWRHTYKIEVISMNILSGNISSDPYFLVILLTRNFITVP